jgi:hypothetical protein
MHVKLPTGKSANAFGNAQKKFISSTEAKRVEFNKRKVRKLRVENKKRREGQKSNVWERFGEVVKEDDSRADYIMCDDCEAIYKFDSHKTGTSNRPMAR